jgi:hypothetical protein
MIVVNLEQQQQFYTDDNRRRMKIFKQFRFWKDRGGSLIKLLCKSTLSTFSNNEKF